MPDHDDAFWDELGISWRASVHDTDFVSSRLEAKLKLQSALLGAGAIAATLLGVLGFAAAARALWIGWTSHFWNFITRGLVLAAVSVLAIIASLALRTRDGVDTRSLRDMLQLSIARTERLVKAADLTCYSLAILVVGGLVGYALRIKLSRPPAISPVEDILILALAALSVIWFRQSQTRALRRYQHIRRAFDSGDELP
jgi:hypothetical protein